MTLLAAYAYDEGSGSTTADATGNGHTATLNNATFTTGHTSGGITNTAANQGATSTVPAVTSAAVTLMAWVKPLDLTTGTSHLACGILQTFNGNTDIGLWTQRADFGTSNVLQGNIRVNGNLDAINGSALTVGTWAHLALTYDGTTARLYKDGTQVATTSASGSISLGTTLYVAGGGPDTDVVVDDVRYYNEVLDATAITTAMNTPVGGSGLTLTDAAGAVRLGSAADQAAIGRVLADQPAGGIRAGKTGGEQALNGLVLTDTAGSVRLSSTIGSLAAGRTLADSPGGIRAGSTPAALAVGIALADRNAGLRAGNTFGENTTSALLLLDRPGAVRLGSTVGALFQAISHDFVCQDFSGTTSAVVDGGTAEAVAFGGNTGLALYGGTASICGR